MRQSAREFADAALSRIGALPGAAYLETRAAGYLDDPSAVSALVELRDGIRLEVIIRALP